MRRVRDGGPARGAGAVCRAGGSVAGGQFGIAALGFVELVFEGDDAAGGVDGGALVDQFACAGGQAQLVAGVAAVAAGGALRGDQARLRRGCAESPGWCRACRRPGPWCNRDSSRRRTCRPHSACRVLLGQGSLDLHITKDPGRHCGTRGPQRVGLHHCQPARPPASCTRVRRTAGPCGDRSFVTEHHLRTRWNCGTRAAKSNRCGRSNDGSRPFLPILSTYWILQLHFLVLHLPVLHLLLRPPRPEPFH